MNKIDVPESFGVFKPVGHVVIAFPAAADLQGAVAGLTEQGLAGGGLVRYTPAEMVQQVDAEMQNASPLASIGQELNLVKAHRALAERGCSFLVVKAADDAQAERIAAVARLHHAVVAQNYGHFIIEELISPPTGEPQVFESPARGLDLPAGAGGAGGLRG